MDKNLLAILVCPETKQKLRIADESTAQQCLGALSQGTLKNIRGEIIKEQFSELLVREDGKIGYRIVDGIPVMLVEEGIPLS